MTFNHVIRYVLWHGTNRQTFNGELDWLTLGSPWKPSDSKAKAMAMQGRLEGQEGAQVAR